MADTAWEQWLRLRERFGRRITLVDLYELEALRRGIDADALTADDRERLQAMWLPVAEPGMSPAAHMTRRNDPVEVTDYDEAWPARFRTWRQRLAAALGEGAVSIEHVGSTAVPGLHAKPIIDIQVLVTDVEDEGSYLPHIESVGVPLRSRSPGERYFRPGSGQPREVHIHVNDAGGRAATERIAFRDHLRNHPEARDAYGRLKRRLAERFAHDRLAYTEAKTAFVLSVLDQTYDS